MNDTLRSPCKRCGGTEARTETRNGQDCKFCAKPSCGAFQYNAPKTETGRAPRTVSTVHNGVTTGKRARILLRATGKCELCGKRPTTEQHGLHVGHLVSVKQGLGLGLTEDQLNDDENLAAMCDECNLGIADEIVPLRLAISIIMARTKSRMLWPSK